MRWFWLFVFVAFVTPAAADPPAGYRCGRGARIHKGVGCACPHDKIPARDDHDRAICAPRPPPTPTTCLAERRGKTVVKIDSSPNGATVYLGAKTCGSVGQTPWTGKLAAGPVRVILERPGYEPVTREYGVESRGRHVLSVTLVRTNIGTIDVRADADPKVAGATIQLDGEARGKVPSVFPATGGRRRLEIVQPGFQPYAQWLEVVDSQTLVVMPVLVPAIVAKGKLVIEADVDAAEVWLDGVRRGTTPIVLDELPVKSYEVEVKKAGATPWTQTVMLTAGQTLLRATLAASLPKTPTGGTLSIKSRPVAEVVIDGKVVGRTPYETELPAGSYWIQLRAAGHATYDKRLALAAGATLALDEKLAATGRITITSTPAGATVYLDSTRVGVTPMTIDAVLGTHAIIVERAGYQRFTRTVNLAAAGATIAVTLKP